jgi:hypothetical protein
MAVTAGAIWRCRVGGNAANGAGYDPTISGAGTDYSTQDSPQLSLTDIACSATTTVTSATGGFTAAMIGNAIRITGGGATSGYYFITARASSTSITVDRTPGTVSGGTGKVGGAARLPENVAGGIVAGNICYLLGSAGNAGSYPTASLDYATTGFMTPGNGNATAGHVKWIADPAGPMPTFGSDGAFITSSASFQWFEGLYITTSGTTFGTLGIMAAYQNAVLKSCVINTNNKAAVAAAKVGSGLVIDNEFYGGTTSPTQSSGSHLLLATSNNVVVVGNTFRFGRDDGINCDGAGLTAAFNQIVGCAGNGINVTAAASSIPLSILYNTIRANLGHGLTLSGTAASIYARILGNAISDHVTAAKAGINFASGSTALNDFMKPVLDYNNLYNNTSNYTNVSAGAHDTSLDPQFTDSASNPFNLGIGTNLKAKGWPGSFRGSSSVGYFDMGAVQRQEAGGGLLTTPSLAGCPE